MNERRERAAVPVRIEVANKRRGVLSEHPAQRFDRRHHGGHAAKCQTCRDKRHDFAIARAAVPPDDLHRIERRLGVIETVVESVQRAA